MPRTEGRLQKKFWPHSTKTVNCQKGICIQNVDCFGVNIGSAEELLAVFKILTSRNYEPAMKTWDLHMTDYYHVLMKAVKHLLPSHPAALVRDQWQQWGRDQISLPSGLSPAFVKGEMHRFFPPGWLQGRHMTIEQINSMICDVELLSII
jgi:hypothetical protein